ncbi:spermatogenesis-associated protein 20 [Bulinus truncatus]|nr:spermatogenesis-associated protein 20 [Bulinus truncatus]
MIKAYIKWMSPSEETLTLQLFRVMSSNTPTPQTFTNRLAQEKSPYLLQHSHNPVDWYPWGDEAFKKAKDEDKPIFLSVGYSTCHWCHVMERESFENVEIGRLLNEHFVSIKVDREERPDVDRVYMSFIQATTGSGGWPMSVWLTPDLKLIVGGTYFPPDDRYYSRPGFKTILGIITKHWNEKREEIESQSTKILDALMRELHSSDHTSNSVPGKDAYLKCFSMLKHSFDEEDGGFGSAPKFPQPVNINLLFRVYSKDPDSGVGVQALQMCLYTLTKMAAGGIHDHISQGFHRYSTDKKWHVPHFEKMLYDQGQMAVAYVDAYQITKDQEFADVAQDIFTYVKRDLSHPGGGFYSAEDADSLPTAASSHKKEGAFCVWEMKELEEHLSDKVADDSSVTLAEIFCHYYGVKDGGNVDPLQDPHDELKGKNVLLTSSTVEDTAGAFGLNIDAVEQALVKCRTILYEVRQLRPRPHLDDKIVAAWNGLMISGFARGGQALGDSGLTDRAIQAAKLIRQHMYKSGRLLRSCYTSENKEVTQITVPIKGFVDDYAYVIRGLLDLYEACFDDSWLAWAEELQTKQNELFWDDEDGGYFTSPAEDNSLVLRLKNDQDGAEPSANSVSAMNLLRLFVILDKPEWSVMAERIFKVYAERIEKIPMAVPELISALLFYHSDKKQIVIVGEKEREDTKELISTVHEHYLPNKVLLVTDGKSDEFLKENLRTISSFQKLDDKATAYVCQNFTCSLPVNTSEELKKLLQKSL